MKILIALIFCPVLAVAQSSFEYGRFASVWVLNKDNGQSKFRVDETNPITDHSPVPVSKLNSVSFYIPDSNRIVFPNGNKFLLSYLINYSLDTMMIDRCDATIYPVETQILVNSEWKTFQVSRGSSCGNSYFKVVLPSRSYYILQIDRPSEGTIPTKYRVKLKMGSTELFSNIVILKLTREEIQTAGLPIKLF